MAGEAVKQNLVHLSNFDEEGEKSASKTATKSYAKRWRLLGSELLSIKIRILVKK